MESKRPLGRNNLDKALHRLFPDEVELCESPEVNAVFGRLGFPAPGKVPVMPLKHQIAQKLHGASEPDSERAHDLVDLQLIFKRSKIDLLEVHQVCERIFAYRKMQSWPPRVVANDGWRDLYATAAEGLPVCSSVEEAIVWANDLIARIDAAK